VEKTHINDRLTLLKSTFKYKNSNIEGSIGSSESANFSRQIEASTQHGETTAATTIGRKRVGGDFSDGGRSALYDGSSDARAGGPVRATHLKIGAEETKGFESHKSDRLPNQP